uniref:Transmembrane protein 107 n=1 Tax=Panagrellus redivivus TaxID=6233 RepID=A0A7E4V7B7_PANRE
MNAFSYQTLCVHVKTAVSVLCALELAVVGYVYFSKVEHPLMICKTVNISSIEEITEGRGPSRLVLNEERLCTNYGLLILLVICHAVADAFALIGIAAQQPKLVIPLLAVLPINMFLSVLFFIAAVFTYLTSNGTYDGYFVALTLAQFVVRVYHFRCGRRLYWYLKQRAETFFAPQSAVLKGDTNVFQF